MQQLDPTVSDESFDTRQHPELLAAMYAYENAMKALRAEARKSNIVQLETIHKEKTYKS
jgi:hypothetical protein